MIRIGFTDPPEDKLLALLPAESFILASLEDCDLAFYGSILWAHPQVEATLEALSEKYRGQRQRLIVVVVDDHDGVYPKCPNLWLLRTSLRRSKKKRYETVFPYLWDTRPEPFPVCPRGEKPTVGFCGLVSKHRQKLIEVMERDPRLVSSFIKRGDFQGKDAKDRDVVKEFNDNLRDNVFNLCNRGAGNFSIRFYQTLAAGRIPVLVNTDIELPFADEISWSRCCIVGKSERQCASLMVKANRSGRTSEMQIEAARVHQEYFRGTKYFEHFFRRFGRV